MAESTCHPSDSPLRQPHSSEMAIPSIVITQADENEGFQTIGSNTKYSNLNISVNGHSSMPARYDGPFDTRSSAVAPRVSPFGIGKSKIGHGSTRPFNPAELPKLHLVLPDAEFYLKFTDDFRDTLTNRVRMYDIELQILFSGLEEILVCEVSEKTRMPFSTVIHARLEKLLEVLLEMPAGEYVTSQPKLADTINIAIMIEKKWEKRFQGALFLIDETRRAEMYECGLLAHVRMERSNRGDGSADWVAMKTCQNAGTSLISFPLGQWWPNVACAARDGVVNLTLDEKIGSHEFVTWVILLKGVETIDANTGHIVYMVHAKHEEVFNQLQDKVGKNIRLIRGYLLKSIDAPKIGIRYDGIYTLKGYSKITSAGDPRCPHFYDVKLEFAPVHGESGVNREVPKPSVRDDWETYKEIERVEKIRRCSAPFYNAWYEAEDLETREVQDWHRHQKLIGHTKELNL